MSTNLNYKQVANVSRRTWDIDVYEKRAKARASNEFGHSSHKRDVTMGSSDKLALDGNLKEEFIPANAVAKGPQTSNRAFLKARSNKVKGLDTKVGSIEIVHPEATGTMRSTSDRNLETVKDSSVTKSGVGWHCKVCDCYLKDSLTYLDHINGRKHQRVLGYSMRVERCTKDQVVSRLAAMVKGRSETRQHGEQGIEENFDEVVKAKDNEMRIKKETRRRERKEQKNQKGDKKVGNTVVSPLVLSKPDTDSFTDEEQDFTDSTIAAMMGFSGFGGGNKNR